MITKATFAAVAILLAISAAASAQSFGGLTQQAIDFQANTEVSRPGVTLPTDAYASTGRSRTSSGRPVHDSLTQQAIDFQRNTEVSR
jgi:hypothetical protein